MRFRLALFLSFFGKSRELKIQREFAVASKEEQRIGEYERGS